MIANKYDNTRKAVDRPSKRDYLINMLLNHEKFEKKILTATQVGTRSHLFNTKIKCL